MGQPRPEPEVPPTRPPSDERLESWKEIAVYLNRDVSTVRRWEKREGLPVHRHLHDKQGTVYAFRSELDSWLASRGPNDSATAAAIKRAGLKKWFYLAGAIVAVLALAGSLLLVPEQPDEPPTLAPTSRPSIAVLYFDNLSEDPSIDWLREGLADMFITDLAQSPGLNVVGTDRIYQILTSMDRLEDPITSSEVVQEVAKRAGAGTVVLGSFMKSGETYRIHVRIQDGGSGEILTAEKVEGSGDASVFRMVDELTRRIKASFEIPPVTDVTGFDRGIAEVTTPSLEAYRYHIEGRMLHLQFKHEEAIALYEKAIAADPGFALALNGFAEAHGMLGHTREMSEFYRRALEHADRLPLRERYYIEGSYYCQWEDTFERSFRALEELLDLYPEHNTGRTVLAWLYGLFERPDEAIKHREELRRNGYARPPGGLAFAYAAKGDFETGYKLLREFVRMNPEDPAGYHRLGLMYLLLAHNDEALEAFEKARELRPWFPAAHRGKLNVFLLQEEWDQAETASKKLVALPAPVGNVPGSMGLAAVRLYKGRSREALTIIEEAIRVHQEPDKHRASMRNFAANMLLDRGQYERALEHAEAAQQEGHRNTPEWEGLFLAARARAGLLQWDVAHRTAEELLEKTETFPTKKEKRRYHHLLGELALAAGDATRAIEELEQARSMLPAHGHIPAHVYIVLPQHVPIWYSLASAFLNAGDDDEAAAWFKRITESTTEHTYWPIGYVRSFYFLAKIYEKQGETEKARAYYQRFYDFWKDGEMDREHVEEAKRKLGAPN